MLFSIFAILVLSILGMSITAMFSDSMQYQITSHQSLQAAHNAESGYRIVAERIANADDQTQRDAVLTQMHDKSLTFSSNMGQADINIQSFFYNATTNNSTIAANTQGEMPSTIPSSGTVLLYDAIHAPATCNISAKTDTSLILTLTSGSLDPGFVFPAAKVLTSLNNGDMTLESSPGPGLFPEKYGTFRFCNCTGIQQGSDVYRFEKRTGNNITGITNVTSPGNFSEATNGDYDCIFMDKFAIITSTGRFGHGQMAVSQKNSYNKMVGYAGDPPASSSSEILPGEEVDGVDLEGLLNGTFTKGTNLGKFTSVPVNEDQAITATKITGGNGNQPRREAYLGLISDTANPFYRYWNSTHFLSYEGQVKIAIGNEPTFSNPPDLYMAGLLLRGTGTDTSTTSYGVSFVRTRTGSGHNSDGIPDSIVPVPVEQTDTPMIVFWDRSGRGSSDDIWLAYKTLNSTDPVLSDGKYLKSWSSLLVRIIEAPSIDISDASSINTGDTITTGNISTKIIRKIGKNNGESVLLLADDLSESLVSGNTIKGGTITKVSGRDNYIWVMYTDTSNHDPANNDPLDHTNRLGTIRNSYSWPINDIQEWDSANDYFTLVQWNENLNISQNSSLERLGTGKELNCILRTNKYVTSSSAWESERWELGINTLGDSATQTYFDDFKARIFSIGAGSGDNKPDPIPPVVTY